MYDERLNDKMDDTKPHVAASAVERLVMCDKDGKKIGIGSVLFYTERPHSNYADSLVHIYDDNGTPKVEALVLNMGDHYELYTRDKNNDLPLENYSWDMNFKPTGKCPDMRLLEGITTEMATVEYANKHFSLDT